MKNSLYILYSKRILIKTDNDQRPSQTRTNKVRKVRTEKGFTLLELLVSFILVGIITTLAMPAIKTVTRRSEALDIATLITQQINIARDQATRRNHAYQVQFKSFSTVVPQGSLSLSEGYSNTCQSLIDRPDQIKDLGSKVFGASVLAEVEPSNRPHVGLGGWRRSNNSAWRSEELEFCINPKGAVFLRSGNLFSELTGHLYLGVQQFFSDPLRPLGPPQQVEVTFSAGAKVKR